MASQKILVIDDSRVIRNMVKEMLPAGNVEVIEAKDGVEGINLVRTEHPTLIMLDFLLPKRNGWDVYQDIQKDPKLRSIPLMIMSGRKEEVTEKLPEPFKYFAFVEKPFEKNQLIRALKEAMQKANERKKDEANHPTPVVATPAPVAATTAGPDGASNAEIQALKQQMAQMQGEINNLKKQLSQLVAFIKQKLK